MPKGSLCIVLHAHLPYVRHPEYDSFFEENWLFEAITECYIPLLNMFGRLQKDQVEYRLTLSVSPTLITMLRDELLIERYLRYLQQRIDLAEQEVVRTQDQPELQTLAQWYRQLFIVALQTYRDEYQCDLLGAIKRQYDEGHLELITTAATHGFLPALSVSETAVRNQILIGVSTFKDNFGFLPKGFWLPECAYYPGLEKLLADAGINYFFVDTHAILVDGETQSAAYAPIDCGNGVLAFGRDPASSRQVWSAQEGYPGDPEYREYYSDIGFELDTDYLSPYILADKTRINTGIKYCRVTGREGCKEIYRPERAQETARRHALDFIQRRAGQVQEFSAAMSEFPILVAPYDAELFGHWWFEGPLWLEQVLRLASADSNCIETVTCTDYCRRQTTHRIRQPVASTWGDRGFSEFWINEENDWIYPYLHQAELELENLSEKLINLTVTSLQARAINQAARSLLLAQASDWPFILKSGTSKEYARKRITDHLARFNYLMDCIRKNAINERYLFALETMDKIFPELDFRIYRTKAVKRS